MCKDSIKTLNLAPTVSLFFFIAALSLGQGAGPGPVTTTLTNFETADFSGSGICAMCHSGLTDEDTPPKTCRTMPIGARP